MKSSPESAVLPRDPRVAIAHAAKTWSNWGRWGADDVRGTTNFITPETRRAAASLIKLGETFSLSIEFGDSGPQSGQGGRINPLYSVRQLATGDESEHAEIPGLPHGIGGMDDMVVMPLQCATQWDSLGHIFDRGRAWNGRIASEVATVNGDSVTGIETMAEPLAGRGVLLDVGRALSPDGELPDAFAITTDHLAETAAKQGVSSTIRRGDIVVVRTGQLSRARRSGWGTYAGGPAPGLSFMTAEWLHDSEIAAIATDTWGFEVRPNEFENSFQPLHQVVIPHIGMPIGEMWDLDALATHCAADGVYEFWLTAGPIPFTGAAGAPVNPIAVK